jgi:hypothetical protein
MLTTARPLGTVSLIPLVLLLGCGPKGIALGDDTATLDPHTPVISVSGGALDPLLAAETLLDVTADNGATVRISVTDAAGTTVRTLADGLTMVDAIAWNGRDDTGALEPVGTYTVHAELLDAAGGVLTSTTSNFYIVRVGVRSGTLSGDRIPLIWHRNGNYWEEASTDPTFEVAAIDDGTTATPLPPLWDDLEQPPEDHVGHTLPAAYPYDVQPTITLSAGGDIGDAPVDLEIAGWGTAQSVSPGDTPVFERTTPLATGPGVVEETLTLTWSVDGVPIGVQSLPARFYATLGTPTFEQEGPPYEPWVAAIDPALRAIQGVEGTDEAVLSALTEWIYRDLGLVYDTRYGASAYTQYAGRGYDRGEFDFTSFLARRNGSTINCSDCASILEGYSDMIGANLEYTIILQNFDLNFIKSIGATDYTHCPFGSQGCGFSYHAVTTPDDAETIYDATLALDGDDDPGAAPFTELLVQTIDGQEYLDRLVMSGNASYMHTQKEYLR